VKILLDECLPHDFRHSFPLHHVHTADWAGLKGRKNGDLLRTAEGAGYNVLLTIDQGIPHQQPFGGRIISVIVIHAPTSQLEDLLPLAAEILLVLEIIIGPGQTMTVPRRSEVR
jgi:hypothetical protein